MPHLSFYLLGTPRLERAGEPIEINTRKALALLAYLALNGQPQRREALTALLWPDSEPDRARAALRSTLWALNKALAGEWLVVDRDVVDLAQCIVEFSLEEGERRLVEGFVQRGRFLGRELFALDRAFHA